MARKDLERSVSRGRKLKARIGLIVGAAAVIAACIAVRQYSGPEPASAKTPAAGTTSARAAAKAAEPAPPDQAALKVVAVVNGQEITRDELAVECLRHYGKDVLEKIVNKYLISQHCKSRGIVVTRGEVDAEIDRLARKLGGVSTDQWLKMLEQERGIKPAQYASDMIWPTLALRKLASDRLTVTRQELVEAYETQFGPSVKARMIAFEDEAKARQIRAAAVKNPAEFGNLARQHSVDVNSASANGLIQPIHKHLGNKEIEQAAFALEPGQISQVIPVSGQFVILKSEGLQPARNVALQQVEPSLTEAIRDRKLRTAAADVFRELQKNATVTNVFNDPVKSRQMPGVAATINEHKITVRELAEECIDRHGKEVLEGTIARRLIEQALKERKIVVTDADVDREIARAAVAMGKTNARGEPDIKAWIEAVTKEQGITVELYRRDAVWPSIAVKKMVGENVTVTEEELQKGFEANYGPRVRCRAIVMDNNRRAQTVWDMARKTPTVKLFGDLAEQYSIEASSRALRGEIPPIQKYGGEPTIEKEAFALKAGEISGIVQVADKFIILFCEGRTEPMKVSFKEVRNLILEDIREKKLRLAMAKEFTRIQESAQIDNYLAGTSQSPQKPKGLKPGPQAPPTRQASRAAG
ncbi:MAG: peptidylprolyl isomerase [Pirellulales bacterium]